MFSIYYFCGILIMKSIKNVKQKVFYTILFLFFMNASLAQSKIEFKEIQEVGIQIENYFYEKELSKAYSKIKSLENRVLADQKNDLQPIVDYYYAAYYLTKKEYDKAYTYATSALQNSSQSNENQTKAYANLIMGIYYHTLGDYASLSDYSLKALNHAKYTGNHKLLGDIYYRLYCVHTQWDDIETDMYAQKALDAYQKIGDLNGLSNAYNAKMFGAINQLSETGNQMYKDSIAIYLRKGFTVFSTNPNQYKKTRAVAALNLADFFKKEYIESQKISKNNAIDSVNKYLEIVDQVPRKIDFKFDLKANSYNIKGAMAMHHKETKKAEEYFTSSLRLLQKEKTHPNFYSLYNAADNLVRFYQKQGNHQKAFHYLEIRNEYNNKIYDTKQRNTVRTLEAKFETEQVKKELEIQKEINASKKTQLWLSIGLLVLAIAALVLLFFYAKKRLSTRKQKLEIIAYEKKQVINQFKLEEEKNARLAAEQKVIALEKERLSKKVMAHSVQIERKNELLQEIKKKVSSGNITFNEIKNALKLEVHTEKSINRKIDEFHDIDPVFFNKLKVLANNKLTDLDLRYCAYLSLGLSNKEIATHLSIEQKSVRMSKYRIKKKLNVDKDISLESFLKNLSAEK